MNLIIWLFYGIGGFAIIIYFLHYIVTSHSAVGKALKKSAAKFVYYLGPESLKSILYRSKNPLIMCKNPCEAVNAYRPDPDMLSQVTASDFERLASRPVNYSGSKIFRFCLFVNPNDVYNLSKKMAAEHINLHPGTFLAKLWTLYGKPDKRKNGFSYTLLERKTGLIFHALLDQDMCIYFGQDKNDTEMIPLCYRFEALLREVTPMNCKHIYKYFFTRSQIGFIEGLPFIEPLLINKEGMQKKLKIFPGPISLDLQELSRMLSIYIGMVAIGNDRLNCGNSMSRIVLEVSGLPAGLTKEQQLDLFPLIKEALGNNENPIPIKELRVPHANFNTIGVYPVPEHNKYHLIQGLVYNNSKDKVHPLEYLLKIDPQFLASKPGITLEMEFLPGIFQRSIDVKKYYLYLKGNLTPANLDGWANLEITGIVGPIDSPGRINAWKEAVKFFAQFEKVPLDNEKYRLELNDEMEAKTIKLLCYRASKDLWNIDVEGKYIIGKNSQAAQLGLIVTYHRYG